MRGLSYQNGVLFIGKEHIGWAVWKNSRPVSCVMPVTGTSILNVMKHVFLGMPLWYKSISGLLVCITLLPVLLRYTAGIDVPGLPVYTIFYFMAGTHFFFPKELRKFHGAEHKVFSFKGMKKRKNLYKMKRAAITNRYCSTNIVLLYFILVAAGAVIMADWYPPAFSLNVVSFAALPLAGGLHRILQLRWMKQVRTPFLSLSYFVQRHVACTVPERRHLRTALAAYRELAAVEFPHLLEEKKPLKKKEADPMAILDITVVPVGTGSTSMSEDVAEIQALLSKHSDKAAYQLTSMGTIIEGNLDDLLQIVKELHEIPFQRGAERVSTNIRIDDRRDKEGGGMTDKVKSVENKLDN